MRDAEVGAAKGARRWRVKMARCSCKLAANFATGFALPPSLVLALAVEFPKIAFPTGTHGLEGGQGEWILY